jgi:hypothetical protein
MNIHGWYMDSASIPGRKTPRAFRVSIIGEYHLELMTKSSYDRWSEFILSRMACRMDAELGLFDVILDVNRS